ncbi:MAG: hypothetical protein ACLQCU_00100 [Acidimicrobiales bacterium]
MKLAQRGENRPIHPALAHRSVGPARKDPHLMAEQHQLDVLVELIPS